MEREKEKSRGHEVKCMDREKARSVDDATFKEKERVVCAPPIDCVTETLPRSGHNRYDVTDSG